MGFQTLATPDIDRFALRVEDDPGLRQIQIQGTPLDSLCPDGARVIVEFKFNGHFPPWMSEVVKAVGLQRISYSKYALSIQSSERAGTMRMYAR